MNVALRTEHLNLISICTGGFGLDLGVELAIPSARTVCMVEREAFAVAQLVSAMQAGHMAPAPIWSDARTFNGRAWRGAVDGLIGGIPCQPHSLAGRKQGQNDERDLWSDARRIIVQSGAWFVLIENVSGMLSAGADEIAGAERVCRDLHKLGFSVEGGLFTASEVGAPHQRERVFILGVADAHRERLERIGADFGAQRWPDAGRSAGLCDGTIMGDPVCKGPHAGALSGVHRSEEGRRPRNEDTSGSGIAVVNAIGSGRPGRSEVAERRSGQRTADEWPSRSALFPPGPNDLDGWRSALAASPELEPAFRRVADGVASRLDIARVDRLRMLGNGVVPLEAAYALRTLITRLAARGSAGAARLVRMMEGTEA
ncbi:DNA cytosine methyltransferase [Agrobacterium pusense]|uniref:DNA cytosine methyltransferase n=1 Tax=Agrobacterium pusense TaxID=648995 RepID=UPI003A5C802F